MRYQFTQPGPGRPKGSFSGRRQALALLDEVLGEDASKRLMRDALRQHLQKNPVAFFRQLVMPLLPSEAKIELENAGGGVEWSSFLSPTRGDGSLRAPSDGLNSGQTGVDNR